LRLDLARALVLECRMGFRVAGASAAGSLLLGLLLTAACAAPPVATSAAGSFPRTADGKPDLQGIWQTSATAWADLEDHAASHNMRAGRSVVLTETGGPGGEIPYLPAAAEQRRMNAASRATADPLSKCYMPGVPRIMYMAFPFQIFQTADHVAMTFEFSQIFRLIYTNGSKPRGGITQWMGDSRGRWEGDTLVVDVIDHDERSWLDMAGNFHSDALKVVERYTMADANTIRYEATLEDPKVFSRSWKIAVPLHRQVGLDRVLEYQCNAEAEEANGAFERDPKTWYPGPGQASTEVSPAPPPGGRRQPGS
jgi:hypothetical protein